MIDLDALKARLAEYDDARPRCQGKVARTINCAPDHLPSDDPTYHEYIITTYSPCCRPEGHAGECRNSRLILGWPGFVTVSALVAEVEHLRSEVERERADAVAHLRDCDKRCREWDGRENAVSGTYRLAAAAIAWGAHRKEKP